MNIKKMHLQRRQWIVPTLLMGFLFVSLRGEGRVSAFAGEPVWGRKPVLAYFALTASLADEFKTGVGLTDEEFEIVHEIARQESDQLRLLEQTTQAIIEDKSLTEAEKRQQIAQSRYNESVLQVVDIHKQVLQEALDKKNYSHLVSWIETHWTRERALHSTLQVVNSPNSARTYTIYATHYDSNGSYAVALPDKCVKFADGGNSICDGSGYSTGQYAVKLSFDETVTVQSFDSGPWNVDDNFWANLEDPHPRRLYTDLPLGMPEAQAAYFDDYNDGLDQYDRIVTAPFAIDLGDEIGSDIGLIPGANDWIEVTFLWTEGWDELQPEVITLFEPTKLEPPYTGDMCITAWHRLFPMLKEGGQAAYLTLNVDDPLQSTNSAEWKPNIPVSGEYLVRAFIPDHGPIDWLCPAQTINFDTGDAEYIIHHADGETTISKNQGPMANQYLDLGTYDFDVGTSGKVTLTDLNDEANLSHTVAFSAMQFRQIVPPPTPTPTPSPTPTPTPTPLPDPYINAGIGIVNNGANITIPIQAGNLQSPGLGQAVIDVQYDPEVVEIVNCQPDPDGLFETETCQPDFDADDIFPDTVRFTINSTSGESGNLMLAHLTFQAIGAPSQFSWINLLLSQLIEPGGKNIPAYVHNGMICIAPCENIWFLPVIGK
ncbi:MAG TPA: hypothetical protein VI451_17305 [Anaerolineales bacterium]|nr:hypothetical protein [Anaerolineales bacterium]